MKTKVRGRQSHSEGCWLEIKAFSIGSKRNFSLSKPDSTDQETEVQRNGANGPWPLAAAGLSVVDARMRPHLTAFAVGHS